MGTYTATATATATATSYDRDGWEASRRRLNRTNQRRGAMDMGRIDDGAVATVAAALARAQAGAWDVLDAPGGDVYRRTARVLLADDGVRAAFASPAGAPSASVVYRPGVNCRAVYALLGYAWDDLDDDASHEAWRVSEWGGEGKPCEVACSGLMIVLPDGQMAAPGDVITRRGDGWVVTDHPWSSARVDYALD